MKKNNEVANPSLRIFPQPKLSVTKKSDRPSRKSAKEQLAEVTLTAIDSDIKYVLPMMITEQVLHSEDLAKTVINNKQFQESLVDLRLRIKLKAESRSVESNGSFVKLQKSEEIPSFTEEDFQMPNRKAVLASLENFLSSQILDDAAGRAIFIVESVEEIFRSNVNSRYGKEKKLDLKKLPKEKLVKIAHANALKDLVAAIDSLTPATIDSNTMLFCIREQNSPVLEYFESFFNEAVEKLTLKETLFPNGDSALRNASVSHIRYFISSHDEECSEIEADSIAHDILRSIEDIIKRNVYKTCRERKNGSYYNPTMTDQSPSK